MEPVFMVLGQSAALAAALSIDKKVKLHEINYPDLKMVLLENKQRLDSAKK